MRLPISIFCALFLLPALATHAIEVKIVYRDVKVKAAVDLNRIIEFIQNAED